MMKTIQFPSQDGLSITADYYVVDAPKNVVVLCHRSHFNRGEYKEIAPKLNKLGYSCLAIDQRSGMKVLGTTNETYLRAKEQRLATGYLDAKPDIEAAVEYAFGHNNKKPVIVIGSSYSASLCLLIAIETKKIAAVAAFSPGEYLKGITLAAVLGKVHTPTVVFSAKQEVASTTKLLARTDRHVVEQYKPKSEGAHGARVLWEKTPGHKEYWSRLERFLEQRVS